ncbi:MAG: NosD domain-containing protein, partial [Gaiellaceae bacterium]
MVALLAVVGALALAPGALGSSLSGSVVLDPPSSVDLTSAGDVDWAVWGSAAGGTSTSLAPDVRKSGGSAISDLTNIDPAPSAPLRGIGQFAGPFAFSWSNGGSTPSASNVSAGLQHNGGPPPDPLGADVSTLGKGFSFDVPAGVQLRTLRVYVATNRADGTLTASLSDGSEPAFIDTLPAATDIRSGIYTITYAAASSGQSLHVSWVETADNCAAFRCDNAAIYAVALSTALVVNTSDDHDDGACNAADCTLREAINAANTGGGGSIAFAIPGGPVTITPSLAPLPTITAPIEIDGTTETAPAGTLGITIDGSATSGNGLVLGPGSDGSTIRGLAINGHQQFEGPPYAGILVQSDGNTIAQNYIGTTADGLDEDSNDQGIVVTGSGNLIGGAGAGNLVSGNGSVGILIDGSAGAHDNIVAANLVGTDSSGNVALSNQQFGISTTNGALHTLIGGNTAADGNVVFGAETGIDVQGIAGVPDNSEIRFNSVGVGKDGTTTLGNSFTWALGVNNADGAIVADNVVGNGESGLALANSNGLIVVRNFVGVDRSGGNQGNTNEGIIVQLANNGIRPQNVLVDGNTVRFNGFAGVVLDNADRTTVTNNVVTDNTEGIRVSGNHNTIGPGNSVRDNFASDTGVAVYAGQGNTITQNSIDGNQGLGIDLVDGLDGVQGVTANDAGDTDSGPNGFQNFPVLASASADGASLDVAYTLDSLPNTTYTVEFFAITGCDGSGNGQGATYLGSRQVKLGGGPGTFAATLTGPDVAPLNSDQSITATATDSNGGTSEFSACVAVTTANVLANLSLTADEPSVPAGAANVPLASVPPSLLGAFAFSPIPNSPIPN